MNEPPRAGLIGVVVVLALLGICVLATKISNRLLEANIKRTDEPRERTPKADQ